MTVRVRFSQASRSARRYLITLEVIFRKGSWRVFRQSLNVLGSTVKISAACASVRSSAAGFAAAFSHARKNTRRVARRRLAGGLQKVTFGRLRVAF